ncbi:MAG TPA: hypothetical protein VIQ74_05605 [Gemmatimonadaceae bacterium]
MSGRSRCIAALGAAVFVLTACVSTSATRLGQGPIRPAFPPDSVAIYLTAADVPWRYEQVALLNSKGDVDYTDEKQMYNSIRKKAGEVGANGVILGSTNEPGAGAKVAHALFGTSANRKSTAVAIWVFKNDSTKAP